MVLLMKNLILSPKRILLLDAVLLILLAGYMLAGVQNVPFHGDESTTIWMSRDFATTILEGDIQAVTYQPPPRRTTEQHMRVITGNLAKITMGVAWENTGFDGNDLNDQWVWGLDIEWNRANGHMPSDRLLLMTRLSSAVLLIVSTALVMAMTRWVANQLFAHRLISAAASWLSAILYGLNPTILMNGRRAMFEGAMLFGVALVGWVTLGQINRQSSLKGYVLIGAAAGIALSAKHSTVFTIALLFIGLAAVEWGRSRNQPKHWYQLSSKFIILTLTALFVFLALTPLWWSNHLLEMPRITLNERQKILDEQVALFGGYDGWGERLEGLWRRSFGVEPQYYEADYWGDYAGVADEISDYESSHLAGITLPVMPVIRVVLVVAGFFAMGFGWWHGQKNIVGVLALWAIGICLISLITTPLNWQRYYLPIQPPLSMVMGLGGAVLLQMVLNRGRLKHDAV